MAPLAAAAGCTLLDLPASDDAASPDHQQRLQNQLETLQHSQGALMMYTSGTTGRPKGKANPDQKHTAYVTQSNSYMPA